MPVTLEIPVSRIEKDDHQLRMNAEQLLRTSLYQPLRRLECRVADGIVELCGTVPSFYLKQVAQSTILGIHDIKGIRNNVFICAAN